MSYSNEERLCYICYTNEGNELIRCSVCNIPTHKECLSLFHINTNNTQKRAKYLDSIYHKIRPFPQLSNPNYRSWLEPWICEKCFENLDEKTHCYFCYVRDGLLAKIRFQPADKKGVSKKKGNDDKQTNWAHLNCILKLYAKIPQYEEESRSFILDKDILSEAPNCRTCGPPFKMDVKCNTCSKFYAHNLCWGQDKMGIRVCSSCEKADNFTQKMDSNTSGNYLHKHIVSLIQSGKFNCFTKKKSEKDRNQGENGVEIVEEKRITDFFIKESENRQRVFVFPNITRESIYGDRSSEPHGKVRSSDLSNRIRPNSTKNKDKIQYEFIIGSESRPEYKLELQVKKEVKKENGSDPDAFFNSNPEDDIKSEMKEEDGIKQEDIKQELRRDEGEFDAGVSIEIPVDKDHVGHDNEYSNHSAFPRNKKSKNLENLAELVKEWYCTSSVQVLKELQKIYTDTYNHKNYQTPNDKVYLTKKWFELLSNFDDRSSNNMLKQFDEKMKKEINEKFEYFQRYRIQCDNYPQVPQGYRRYKEIWDYAPAVESESYKQEIKTALQSRKSHRCERNCACCDLDKLGPYLIDKQTWKTECPGRAGLHECDNYCGCDPARCKNRSIATKTRKRINEDLRENYAWGIDFATHNHILVVLPEIEGYDKNDFIEHKLLRAVNLCKTPYDMAAACRDIINEAKRGSRFFDERDRHLAKLLSRAIKFVNTFDPSAFRVYTKGYGVLCINENGIPANDLIAEYFGEIYTPWRWFEKQDLIKRFAKEKNKKDELPDFYNIMLERHKDDPDGYDVLFVDPINKGNFSSRFSHSCDPNCGTITTVSNGRYCVAMYSLKPISYGEELTFDYYSVTENEKEHKQAVCLCGSRLCKTYYLQLVTSKQQNAYLDKHLCFLKRNWLVYLCNEPLDEEDKELLQIYSFGNAILEGCPTWLKKWAALILKFIKEERDKYVEFTFPRKKQEVENQYQKKPLDKETIESIKKQLDVERYPLESDRVQNLAITLNKVKHVLNLIKEKSLNPGKHEPIIQEKIKYRRDSDDENGEEEMYDDEDDQGSEEFYGSGRKSSRFNRDDSDGSDQKVMPLKAMKDIREIQAPFRSISKEEICNSLWDRGEENDRKGKADKTEGILNEFLEIIEKHDQKKELQKAIEYQKSRTLATIARLDPTDHEARFYYIRKLYLEISNCLKSMQKNTTVDWQGLSDILYFYAFTFTYFTSNNYPSVTSETEATVRACDMPEPQKYIKKQNEDIKAEDEAQILKGEKKVYNGSYIWGQLAIWWKQTVDKPEASLSQDRRGTLSYPAPSSFVDTTMSSGSNFDYPHGVNLSRINWLKKLIEAPANSWPTFKSQKKGSTTGSWSFKNDLKMYGTFLMDTVIMRNRHPELLEKIIKFIDKPNEKRIQLFEEINKYYHERINYTLPQAPQDGRDLSIFPQMNTQPIVLNSLITLQQPAATRGMNFRQSNNNYSD